MIGIRRVLIVLCLAGTGALAQAGPPVGAAEARQAALAVFRILQRQDWVALYSTVALSEGAADGLPPRAEDFAADVRKGIGKNQGAVDEVFGGMSDVTVGDADIRGDYATLPTACTINLRGQKVAFRGRAHLIRRHHAWKWDLTFSDNAEDATSRALSELVGKPPEPGK